MGVIKCLHVVEQKAADDISLYNYYATTIYTHAMCMYILITYYCDIILCNYHLPICHGLAWVTRLGPGNMQATDCSLSMNV